MYFPEGLKSRLRGPGSIFVGGVAATSFVFGAIAFGILGLAAATGIVLLLFFSEIYREASCLSRANIDLTDRLTEAERYKDSAIEARSENSELKKLLDDLKKSRANPPFDLGELLEALTVHRRLIHLVRQHRQMQDQIEAAHVTLFELIEEGRCRASAMSVDADTFDGEEVALVESGSHRLVAFGGVTNAQDGIIKAELSQHGLPGDLLEELQTQGPVRRSGFVLVFAGTVDPRYVNLGDEELRALEGRLEELSRALSSAMSTSVDQTLDQAEDALRTLEAEANDEPALKKSEAEVGGSK